MSELTPERIVVPDSSVNLDRIAKKAGLFRKLGTSGDAKDAKRSRRRLLKDQGVLPSRAPKQKREEKPVVEGSIKPSQL